MIKQQIDQDLKAAMLAGDKPLVSILRGMKSAILYAEVADSKREEGLDEASVISVLQKEAKKRQEAANLYEQGGNSEKQQAELYEKEVIGNYLPAAMGEDEIGRLINQIIDEMGEVNTKDTGKIIGAVKARAGGSADGTTIANLVKRRLTEV